MSIGVTIWNNYGMFFVQGSISKTSQDWHHGVSSDTVTGDWINYMQLQVGNDGVTGPWE